MFIRVYNFMPIKTATSLKEKLCVQFLSCSTNVIGHIFKNLCKESFKLTRIESGIVIEAERKERE